MSPDSRLLLHQSATEPAWHEEARRLRAEGLSIRQIAAKVGRAHGTVGELFKPPTRTCDRCGGDRYRQSNLCRQCVSDAADDRRCLIQRLWKAGRTMRDIATALDTSIGTVEVEMHRMRAAGWELPYRYDEMRREAAIGARWPSAA